MSKIEIWETTGEVVSPDDLRLGRVEAGPLHGAATIAAEVYTVMVKQTNSGCHCALRLPISDAKRIIQEKLFTVESTGYWTSFSSPEVAALRFSNGDTFKVTPSVFD